MNFKLTILGCNSALPTSERNPTAQVLEVRERFFLIDCGEGTQVQIRKNKIRLGKIHHIFISHLHGDHFFGLFGLISTFSLLQRNTPLNIYSPPGLKKIILPVIRSMGESLSYPIIFHEIQTDIPRVVFEDEQVEITAIPMNHRIPCSGFLFKEKESEFNLKRNAVSDYGLGIKEIQTARSGKDIHRDNGDLIPFQNLVLGRKKSRSYAFYADTMFDEKWIDLIHNVDLLYHEATFLDDKRELAEKTGHSTAKQAGMIAFDAKVKKLILGHYSSRYRELDVILQEAKSVFEESYLSYDGFSMEIPDEFEKME